MKINSSKKEVTFSKGEFDKLYQVFASHESMSDNFYGDEDCQEEVKWCKRWMNQMDAVK